MSHRLIRSMLFYFDFFGNSSNGFGDFKCKGEFLHTASILMLSYVLVLRIKKFTRRARNFTFAVLN
jgi:hypothetical protein